LPSPTFSFVLPCDFSVSVFIFAPFPPAFQSRSVSNKPFPRPLLAAAPLFLIPPPPPRLLPSCSPNQDASFGRLSLPSSSRLPDPLLRSPYFTIGQVFDCFLFSLDRPDYSSCAGCFVSFFSDTGPLMQPGVGRATCPFLGLPTASSRLSQKSPTPAFCAVSVAGFVTPNNRWFLSERPVFPFHPPPPMLFFLLFLLRNFFPPLSVEAGAF